LNSSSASKAAFWAASQASTGDIFGYRYLQPRGSSTFTGLINIRPFDLTISF
jgi:hypothetical protein